MQPVVVTHPTAIPLFAAVTLHATAAAPHSIVVTQFAVTSHAATVESHSTVVSQLAVVPISAPGLQLASTIQSARASLPTEEKPATLKNLAEVKTLKSFALQITPENSSEKACNVCTESVCI